MLGLRLRISPEEDNWADRRACFAYTFCEAMIVIHAAVAAAAMDLTCAFWVVECWLVRRDLCLFLIPLRYILPVAIWSHALETQCPIYCEFKDTASFSQLLSSFCQLFHFDIAPIYRKIIILTFLVVFLNEASECLRTFRDF